MLQGTFALMNRSLRVDDRLLRTHLFRLGFLTFTYFMVIITQRQQASFGAPGLRLFVMIIFLNFFFILLAAAGFFSSSISEEKEEMTLGLLQMAGVQSLSLLLGKYIPRLAWAILLLVSQIPFMMLAITLGGISVDQVIAAYVTLLTFLWCMSSIALLCSVIAPRSHSASVLTTVFFLIYFVGPPILLGCVQLMTSLDWVEQGGIVDRAISRGCYFMFDTAAFLQLQKIGQTGFNGSLVNTQTVFNSILGLVAFLSAWAAFPVFARDEKPAGPGRNLGTLTTRRRGGWSYFRPGRAWKYPLPWKDFHFIAGGTPGVVSQFLLFGCLILAAFYVQYRISGKVYWWESAGVLMWTMTVVAGIQIAALSGRVFSEEVKWRTLTSLMLIPRNVANIAYGKFLGCCLSLAPTVFFFVCGTFMFFASAKTLNMNGLYDSKIYLAIFWGGSQTCLLFHLTAFYSLHIKWGGLPAAFGTLYAANAIFSFLMTSEQRLFLLNGALGVIGIVVLQVLIGKRLQTLAAR